MSKELSENEFESDKSEQETEENGKSTEEIEKQKIARKEQKEKTIERKLQKPNADLILSCKKIWDQLRRKELPKNERGDLMEQMMKLVAGKALEIIFKHDASRIIQSCLKYGNTDQRNSIAAELSGSYARISQSKYAKFIVSKVLKFCPDYRQSVVSDFHGNVKRLIRHKEASLILDEVYSQYANSAQRMSLMEEFYGPEFAVFKSNDGPSTLEGLIEKHPMKKQSILKYLRSAIDSVLEKATFNVGKTPILHRAILDYLNVADESVSKDMIEMLKDHLVHMLHTREGALVTQYCILHATPKDRKQIIKSFKGFMHSIAKEQYGHAVLITCFECVDDTVLVGKAIIGELFKPASSEGTVGELLSNQYGSRVILFLLCGRNKRYQPIYLIEELEKTDAVRAKTTKKESDIRHKQLVEVTSPFLLESVTEHANELLHDKQGSAVLVETFNNAVGDLMPLIKAVSDLCAKAADGNIDSYENEKSDQVVNVIKKMKVEKESEIQLSRGLDLNESVLVNRFSTLAIKHLLLKPKEGDIPGWKLEFGQNLWDAIKPNFEKLVTYCSNNPRTAAGLAFILVALFENSTELIQKNMNSIAKKFKKKCLVLVSETKGNKKMVKEAGATKKRKSSEKECGIEILLHQL